MNSTFVLVESNISDWESVWKVVLNDEGTWLMDDCVLIHMQHVRSESREKDIRIVVLKGATVTPTK